MKIGKKLVAVGIVAAAGSALAQSTYQTYGNMTYGYNASTGQTSTYQTYGNMTYGYNSSGQTSTYQTYGNTTYGYSTGGR